MKHCKEMQRSVKNIIYQDKFLATSSYLYIYSTHTNHIFPIYLSTCSQILNILSYSYSYFKPHKLRCNFLYPTNTLQQIIIILKLILPVELINSQHTLMITTKVDCKEIQHLAASNTETS